MAYFNETVLAVLSECGVSLSQQEKVAYLAKCIQIKKIDKGLKTQKNPDDFRQYSLWHLPSDDQNINASHWMVLPGPANWETRDRHTLPKRAINILTGEQLFLKIRRPAHLTDNTNMVLSMREFRNNQRAGTPVKHCERQMLYGYKAYLFQPYAGKYNLYDIVEGRKESVDLTLGILITSGRLLQNLHDKKLIHGDFKFENIVYNEKTQHVSIVDVEHLLSDQEGASGIHKLQGTSQYLHPDWMRQAGKLQRDDKPLIYTIQNDVYAYIVTACGVLVDLDTRVKTDAEIAAVEAVRKDFDSWFFTPFQQLPDLQTVINKLQSLQRQLVNMKGSANRNVKMK